MKGYKTMNFKQLFRAAIGKVEEQWAHEIISSKQSLQEWMSFERNIYANDPGYRGGYFALVKEILYGSFSVGYGRQSFI